MAGARIDDIEQLRAAVASAPVVLFSTDQDGICIVCEGRGPRIGEPHGADIGHPASDLLGDTAWRLPGGLAMTGKEALARALKGDSVDAETRAGDAAFEVRLRPRLDDESREVVGVVGAISGALSPTSRSPSGPPGGQEARERQLAGDRLAAVDTLAAGLAHEINNPLTYTLINAEHVLRRLRVFAVGDSSPGELASLFAALPSFVDSLAQTLHGVQRVREVIRNLMTFSRGGIEASTLIDVRGVAESSIQMGLHEIVPRARLVRELGEVAPVLGNEARLGQVFLCLIVNAAQAIPDGDGRQHEVRVCSRMDGDHVVVEVSDTGAGIAPEILPRIFDPFFTSRGPGQATGMGLSICHGTVKKMGGEILVTSTPGAGTCFRVVLPPAQVCRTQDPIAAGARRDRADRRVLVLDEDALVGQGLSRALADLAEVSIFTDANAALERLAAGERWEVILCEIAMSEMSGIDVYREILRTAPDVAARVVFMTAGAFTPHARAFLDSVSSACLEKPFEVAKIRSLIGRVVRD